jgi:hypothetical protein
MSERTCQLCGNPRTSELVFGLVRWKQPVGNRTFDNALRCKNRAECRSRVEAEGLDWLLEDTREPRR